MTDTYPDDAPTELKIKEELRCIRMAMERLMRIMDEGMFVDYQFEKFSIKDTEQHVECPNCKRLMPMVYDVCSNCHHNLAQKPGRN